MKTALLNYRYYALGVLFFIAFVGILCVPCGEPTLAWYIALAASKAIGFGTLYAAVRLVRHWDSRGEIPELVKFIND